MAETYVVCDECRRVIHGTRHKCANCCNFDLCASCFQTTQHPTSHIFLVLPFAVPFAKEPSFDAPLLPAPKRSSEVSCVNQNTVQRALSSQSTAHAFHSRLPEYTRHSATCDSCNFDVRGLRYKCAHCIDYGTVALHVLSHVVALFCCLLCAVLLSGTEPRCVLLFRFVPFMLSFSQGMRTSSLRCPCILCDSRAFAAAVTTSLHGDPMLVSTGTDRDFGMIMCPHTSLVCYPVEWHYQPSAEEAPSNVRLAIA